MGTHNAGSSPASPINNLFNLAMLSSAIFLCLTNSLFIFGLFGICYNGHNFLRVLLCLEMLLASISMNFIFFSVYTGIVDGFVFALCILGVSAAEVVVGLGMLVYSFYFTKSVVLGDKVELRG